MDILAANQTALDGQTRLFLMIQDDGLGPQYGRIAVTGGHARLLVWETGGSVCAEALAATSADQVMVAARARAREAESTRPNIEDELLDGYRPSDRRATRHGARWLGHVDGQGDQQRGASPAHGVPSALRAGG